MKNGKIFIISGPSAVGQGTVIGELLLKKDLDLEWGKAYTTRAKRESDKKENKYYFVDDAGFNRLADEGEIFEHTNYGGYQYGSSLKAVEMALNDGKNIIRDIDYVGAEAFINKFSKEKVILIFLYADIDTIKKRLTGRGQNTAKEIEVRLEIAQKMLDSMNKYDYMVENVEGKPEIAIEKIAEIIKSRIGN